MTTEIPTEARPNLMISGINTVFANFAQIVCFVLSSVILARALGPEGKGAIDLYVMTASFVVLLTGLSIQSGVTYVVARGAISLRRLTGTLSRISLFQALIALALLLAAGSAPGMLFNEIRRAILTPGLKDLILGKR